MRRVFLLSLAIVAAGIACGGPKGDAGSTTPAPAPKADAATESGDAGAPDAAGPTTLGPDASDAGGTPKGPPPSSLPVSYARPDDGTPLTAAELQTATDELIAILKDTRYFDFVDERVHGWPETDPNKGYWWGAFWTGITVTKAGGTVTYKHGPTGSDNSGIHTAPYLESACYAHLLWGAPKTAHLVRRMARGFSAWILAMERSAGDTQPRVLSRTFYGPSVTSAEGGRSLFIDTSANRPGIESAVSGYVHLANNPTFGDIYVKIKRSKDDIGHMLRAMVQSGECAPRLDAPAQADMAQLFSLYEAWAKDVDGRGFVIPTRDAAGNLYEPSDGLARYSVGNTNLTNTECVGATAVRLLHSAAVGNLDCPSGVGPLEPGTWPFLQDDARQIMRSHHGAATALALKKKAAAGLPLLEGLGERVARDYDYAAAASPPANYDVQDVAGFMAYAAAVGVPLRSKEIRFLHGRLHQAYVGVRDPKHAATFHLFDASVPDGTYSYDPPNIGFYYFDLGLLLGSCASPYRNPTARPVLDCARLIAAF